MEVQVKDFTVWKHELEELLCRLLGEPVVGLENEDLRRLYAHGYSVRMAVAPVLDLPRVHRIGELKVFGRLVRNDATGVYIGWDKGEH